MGIKLQQRSLFSDCVGQMAVMRDVSQVIEGQSPQEPVHHQPIARAAVAEEIPASNCFMWGINGAGSENSR